MSWATEHATKIEQLLAGQKNISAEIQQETVLKLHEYLGYVSQMLDERELSSAPSLFSLNTKDRSKWNPATYFNKIYILTPFCESEEGIHSCEDGKVEFKQNQDWWKKMAPWIGRGTKILSIGLQLGFAGLPLAIPAPAFNAIKDDVDFMKEVSEHLSIKPDATDIKEAEGIVDEMESRYSNPTYNDDRETKLMKAALFRMLEAIAPNNFHARQWGSLSRVRMSDNTYRWLCNECATRRKS